MSDYDLVVIGGGIHGCAAAANAAHRGLSVLLVEKGDLASQTSSASSKLIHGGLRYLEHGEFQLVSHALAARRNLLQQAPHLVHPLAFVLPVINAKRPKWQIHLGLKCYDFLARKDNLSRSQRINKQTDPDFFTPLHPFIQDGFVYHDAQTDDARLTIENALRAKQFGAFIRPRTSLTAATTESNQWRLTLNPAHGAAYQVTCKAIVNTAGPWVNQVQQLLQVPSIPNMTLVKGSHLILPSLYAGEHAYILQHPDQRIVFCTPYHGYTMVGTTDVPYADLNSPMEMDESEAIYLCELLGRYFKQPISRKNIVYHWSGVRTLLSNANRSASELSRSTSTYFSQTPAPVVSLYGGKLTTHQHTAQLLIDALGDVVNERRLGCQAQHFRRTTHAGLDSPAYRPTISGWAKAQPTALEQQPFPGAICSLAPTFSEEIKQLRATYHWVPDAQFSRYINQYGTRTSDLLNACNNMTDLGECIAPTLFAKEIDFLCEQEWAETAEDILWRRSKLGLWLNRVEKMKVEAYLAKNR